MGMAASALFTVVDGIFVGNGIGSDAMAAVNISAPIFMIITGVGLMFGMGGGILTSINLSQGKRKLQILILPSRSSHWYSSASL